jgi:hypothetical protein
MAFGERRIHRISEDECVEAEWNLDWLLGGYFSGSGVENLPAHQLKVRWVRLRM